MSKTPRTDAVIQAMNHQGADHSMLKELCRELELELGGWKPKKDPVYLLVKAKVRYWEDAEVNGAEDEDGSLIPCRNGDHWEPVIEIATGRIVNWEQGKEARIHYKVCDAGQYWLADGDQHPIAKWQGDYVPDDVLAIDDCGYGDYIIMEVDKDGVIHNWQPEFKESKWI